MVKRISHLTLVGLILLTAGIVMAGAGALVSLGRIHVVQAWPRADARVVEAMAKYPPETPSAEAHYQFAYRVGDQDYLTNYVSRGGVEQVRDRVGSHAMGADCTIRYNPANPNEISPNLDYNFNSLGVGAPIIGGGGMLFLLGAALAILGIRSDNRF